MPTDPAADLDAGPPALEPAAVESRQAGAANADLEAGPATKERTPYVPDNQSMRVLLGALGVGAAVAVAVIVLLVILG